MPRKSSQPVFFNITRPTNEVASEITRIINNAKSRQKKFLVMLRNGQWEVHSQKTNLAQKLIESEIDNVVGVYSRDIDVENHILEDMRVFSSAWEDIKENELVS